MTPGASGVIDQPERSGASTDAQWASEAPLKNKNRSLWGKRDRLLMIQQVDRRMRGVMRLLNQIPFKSASYL
jgi:hypothetical protein